MSHFIDTDSIRNKIYLLIQMSMAAENFVSRFAIGVDGFEKSISKDQYWLHTKSTVSNYSLEIAVKLRNALELLRSNKIDINLKDSVTIFNAGSQADGQSCKKDVKFIFDKIIHAKSFQIDSEKSPEKHECLLWWNGTLKLSGTEKKKPWCFIFKIEQWCEAVLEFLSMIEVDLQRIKYNSEDLISRRLM